MEKKQYVIGFSQSGEADAWRKSMLDEMNRELLFHPNLKMIYKETHDNVPVQIKQVNELLDQGIDVLIISATDATQLVPVVTKVYRSGIPVIVLDRNIASQNFTNHIGADNKQIGAIAGKYIANILNGKGNILEITGQTSSSPAIDRSTGFDSVVKLYPQLHIAFKVQGDWLAQTARSKLEDIGPQLVNVQAVFAHNDVMGNAASYFIDSIAHRKIPVIGVDALPGPGLGLEMVKTGRLTGSIIYPTGGKEAIRNAALLASNKKLPRQTVLKTALIDSTNVETLEMQLDKIASQQEDIEAQQHMLHAQQKIYKSQRTYITILGIFVGLLLLAATLLWYSRIVNRRINRALYKKNRDINSKNEQIKQMSLEAQETHEAKINFFTKISHEFRTPLSLIITPLEDILTNPKLSKELKAAMLMMKKNAYRLLQLVTQLMDLRKIEFGKFQLQVSQDDIVDFSREVLQSFDGLARQRHITIRVASVSRAIHCFFDAYIVEKILLNLLSNAFKFTPDGGDIQIRIKEDRECNEVILVVEDTGYGMDEVTQKLLFSFFHSHQKRQIQSNGIGLSLVRELVLLHHGKVSVDSQPGIGTKVSFSIPLEYDYDLQEVLPNVEGKAIAESENLIYTMALDNSGAMEDVPDASNLYSGNSKRSTVLIVEDNDDLRNMLYRKLTGFYDVATAKDGKSAIKALYELLPDLIVCDIMLPDMDGLEITRRCKNDIKTSYIPVVLLTARTSDQQYKEGLKSLANAYVTKPFHFDVLLETINSLLANNFLLKEHYTSLGNTHRSSHVSDNVAESSNTKQNRKFVTDFISVVEQNLANEQLNVQMICNAMHISKVQLYRKVKSLMKTNVNEYILSARILKAKSYLLDGELTIAEIAFKTGFSTSSYFSTVFKRLTGTPPSEFGGKKTI
ncbi:MULTISPECIES: substrate-binding domain-containing protein [Chitinophagaceae]